VKRLRWALARLFAPERIIRDPFPEAEGLFIYYQSDPDDRYRLQWVMKAERFRLKSTTSLASLDYGEDDFTYRPRKPFTRFVGTVSHD
jgi:hypothetical protein